MVEIDSTNVSSLKSIVDIFLTPFPPPLFVNIVCEWLSKAKDVDIVCVTVHCGLQSTACALDANCQKVVYSK